MDDKKISPRKLNRYKTDIEPFLDEIVCWRRDGATEEEIAYKLGFAYTTFREYKTSFPSLTIAVKKGREHLIQSLETSLYKRAMGYNYEETTTKNILDPETGEVIKSEKTTMRKHLSPDVGAIAFALKNLATEKWKERRDIVIDKPQTEDDGFIEALESKTKEVWDDIEK